MKKTTDLTESQTARKLFYTLTKRGGKTLAAFVFGLAIFAFSTASAFAATYTVTSTADDGSITTLRGAITAANSSTGADIIDFRLAPGSVISPTSSLPQIINPVTITGSNGVVLDGSMAGSVGIGLRISAANSVVQGLTITRFQEAGIRIDGGGSGTILTGNFIGTNGSNATGLGNFNRGILIVGTTGNIIGGANAGDRNIISGNQGRGIEIAAGGAATIINNYIGTTVNGLNDLGNTQQGISIVNSSNSNIGDGTVAGRNVISGNGSHGISIIADVTTAGVGTPATNNTVAGNFIGTNSTGNARLILNSTTMTTSGNDGSGISVQAGGNTIGGSTTGARNVISGNAANGITVSTSLGIGNIITGNNIGVGTDGTTAILNRDNGVQISNLASGNTVSSGNIIANNGDPASQGARAGIYVDGTAGTGNALRGNSIFNNTGLGIDLGINPPIPPTGTAPMSATGTTPNDTGDPDTGANDLQNFPVLNSANTSGLIGGTLNSTANTTFAIDFYANAAPDTAATSEARTYIGTIQVTTDGSGNALISYNAGTTALMTAGQFVTATATSVGGAGAQAINDTSEISSAQAVTPATTGGSAGLESDVSPRPNGDGKIISGDVIQTRRFVNGTDTPDPNTNEFQRADSAPFDTRGDAMLLSDDVVQARRYQNGSDAPQPANGPTTRANQSPPPAGAASRESRFAREGKVSKTENVNAPTAPRELRVESTTGRTGQQVTVNIRVDAVGDESEYNFILNYDQTRLTNPVIGAGNAGATTNACNVGTVGQINCSVGAFPNNNPASANMGIGEIAPGNNQILITITFTIPANAMPGVAAITFPPSSTNPNVSNDAAMRLPITGTNGTVTIAAARALRVESVTARSGGMVTVNLRVDAVGDEANYGFKLTYDTSRLINPVIGAGNAGAAVRDCNLMTAGQINCGVEGFPNNLAGSSDPNINEIAPGDNQILLTITFTIPNTAPSGQGSITFQPDANVSPNPNVSNDAAMQLPIAGQGGFVNVNGPTAAAVTVKGRVTARSRGVAGARVSMTGADGKMRYATTNTFGYYQFTGVAAGETYVFKVSAKRYEFASQVVDVNEDIGGLNFTAGN